MSMPEFIENNMGALLSDWEGFAQRYMPGADRASLRDDARSMLEAIAEDMASEQSAETQRLKSRGDLPANMPRLTNTAQAHAAHRLAQGFTLDQMASEYRALRASVIHRWLEQVPPTADGLLEVVRFGEAIDQSLGEALKWHSSRLERSRELFLAALGHDLRAPLAAILSGAEALLLSEELQSKHVKTAVNIRNSGKRMSQMIQDLLDFTRTRLVSDPLPMSPVPTDLEDICREMVAELRMVYADSVIDLQLEGDVSGEWDETRLEQMLSNLVSNALQHSVEGSRVSVHARGNADEVVIAVHNMGSPIPAEAQKTLFEPLMRSDAQEARRGSSGLGLGLYIARQIAEAHGGCIEVGSTELEGTTFTARLPRRLESAAPRAPISAKDGSD